MTSFELQRKYKGKELQKFLNQHLDCHLVVDGIMGRNTRKCLKKYEALENKPNDHGAVSEYNWVDIAKGFIGTKEYSGKTDNLVILNFLRKVGLNWSSILHDSTPWCGAFAGAVMLRAGYSIPKYSGRALSWLNFGFSVGRPAYGAIAVKSRTGGGHVTFVVGRHPNNKLMCLGGNQGDSVKISLYDESVFKDFRLPYDYEDKIIELYEVSDKPYEISVDIKNKED